MTTQPDVLRLTDSTGRVLATLTLPFGSYLMRVVPRGEPYTVLGEAVVIERTK